MSSQRESPITDRLVVHCAWSSFLAKYGLRVALLLALAAARLAATAVLLIILLPTRVEAAESMSQALRTFHSTTLNSLPVLQATAVARCIQTQEPHTPALLDALLVQVYSCRAALHAQATLWHPGLS